MMMNRFDLGGCCLARYGAATPYFASKTDQIMSRYRPIAPKPVVQGTGAVVDGVQQNQQVLPPPVESSNSSRIRNSCARIRKRSWDAATGGGGGGGASSPSPRGHKRAARSRASAYEALSPNSEGQQQHHSRSPKSSVVVGSSSQTTLRPHSDISEGGGLTLCEISDSAASKNFGLARSSLGYSSSSCTSFDSSLVTQKPDGLLEKDAAFMERAAASASPHVGLPERKPINKQAVGIQPMQPSAMEGGLDASNPNTQVEKQKQDLVTLPLLPIAPSPSPSRSCVSNLSTRETMQHHQHQNLCKEDAQLLPELSLNKRSPLVDVSLLDLLYSASSDPVILTDDSYAHRVIWYNSAYKRLVSAPASEVRTPTPLASFKQPFGSSVAILWGFSNKYMGGGGQGMEVKKGVGVGVIMPQPMRPVGSSVVVECITDTHLEAFSPLSGTTIDVVEEQLESQSSPCLISDSNNRVRWANSAYKQMIGQPECSWLDSPSSDQNKKSVKVTRIHGEVMLVFNVDRLQLEEPIAAFSCRVKIQWTNGGEKSSMTVPCDVVKINGNGESIESSYAWQFDIQAALSL